MSGPIPVTFAWDGEAMAPLPRFAKLCDRQYVVGEQYTLVPHEGRSEVSHRHYFASINEGWKTLPDHLAERFNTPEHLRKYCLIKAGYHDERSIVCASKAEALRVAAFIKPMDDFAIVTASEAVVKVYTAKSQSKKAMGARDFQLSKQAVLDLISSMLGVETKTLEAQAA